MIKNDLYQILISPIRTEKTTMAQEKGQYVFKVLKSADKMQIKKSVELVFGAKVSKVSTLIVKPKEKTFRGRKGKRSGYKKALVTLEEGQNIDFNIGIENDFKKV